MNHLDNLTVCITNFKRPGYLDRTLEACRNAGIRRIVVASVCGDDGVEEIMALHKSSYDWLSFDIARVNCDIGCNNTWMLAAYHARTSRIIVMHDDDFLDPTFGAAYENIIAPQMDKAKCFATWRADLVFDHGGREATEYWSGGTRLLPSRELLKVVGVKRRLSLSPVIAIFDRQTVIQACKEAEQTLTQNAALEHPGMLLGTEIVVYMRHIRNNPHWFYVDQVLSHYGSHPGSGTVKAQKGGQAALEVLFAGYDLARDQGMRPQPPLKPKILLVSTFYDIFDPAEEERIRIARDSWMYHFSTFDMLDFPLWVGDLRPATVVGEPDPVSFVRDIFDRGVSYAMPEDIVVVTNRDVGLTTPAYERIVDGVARGKGVTTCMRRALKPQRGRLYKNLANCRTDDGFDVFAVTPACWAILRNRMPDMLNGREVWDTVFRVIAEEYSESRTAEGLTGTRTGPQQWAKKLVYTDHVCWHEPHLSKWQTERETGAGQIHNRKLARTFFKARRGFDEILRQIS